MGFLDTFWHLLNFLLPALFVGAMSAGLAKLLWRRSLDGARWWALARWSASGAALAMLVGLWLFGRDGRLESYALLAAGAAVGLWWAAFGRRRRT